MINLRTQDLAWYCARTRPKHEHIAAADIHAKLQLEVFQPRFRLQKITRAGVLKRVSEPLFPCYIFVRCAIHECVKDLRHANGISTLVHFAGRIPTVPDDVITELQACFAVTESLGEPDPFPIGTEVILTEGAFAGMHASVLRALPARQRVQVMLDILGRPTAVEVDWHRVIPEHNRLAELDPFRAAPAIAVSKL